MSAFEDQEPLSYEVFFVEKDELPGGRNEPDLSAESADTTSVNSDDYDSYDGNFTIHDHVKLNREHFDAFLQKPSVKIAPKKGHASRLVIQSPTASHMRHSYLNPISYAYVQGIADIRAFAEMLDAPADWEARVDDVLKSRAVMSSWIRYCNVPASEQEQVLEAALVTLVLSVIGALDLYNQGAAGQVGYGVGGYLARCKYAIFGVSDAAFQDFETKVFKLVSEVKTDLTFTPGDLWYRSSRGCQVLGAMYWCNCPALLTTQSQFKFFLESTGRDTVFSFPSGTLVGGTNSPDFVAALVLCLLSGREKPQSVFPKSPEKSSVPGRVRLPKTTPAKMRNEKARAPTSKLAAASSSASSGGPAQKSASDRVEGDEEEGDDGIWFLDEDEVAFLAESFFARRTQEQETAAFESVFGQFSEEDEHHCSTAK